MEEEAKDDVAQIVTRKKGHRWVMIEKTQRVVAYARCVDCGFVWPEHGDLAPMPFCQGLPARGMGGVE